MVTFTDVTIDFSGTERLILPKVQTPITYKVLVERLKKLGHWVPKSFLYKPNYDVKVTSGKSSFDFYDGAEINIDEPLIQFYNETYMEIATPTNPTMISDDVEETQAKIVGNQKIEVGGLTRIGFQRTIRVPDNDETHALPPDMGPFKICNTANFANKLPPSVSSKGGICIAMYQREAMWLSFSPIKHCAIKVSVGGINAITGTPQGVSVPGKQDYLALGDQGYPQFWLDGIAPAPGVVRQFVAAPLGKGLIVEGQITGREVQGGVQFDVFPKNSTTVAFKTDTASVECLSIDKAPSQLGLTVGSHVSMVDIEQIQRLVRDSGEINVLNPRLLNQGLHLHAAPKRDRYGMVELVVKTLTGKLIHLVCQTDDTISNVKCMIQDKEGIPPDQQRLVFLDETLDNNLTLAEYDIRTGCTIDIILGLRGGGGGGIHLLGIGVGGRILQKIYQDPLPATAYNFKKVARLHVSIINASTFSAMTGHRPPPSPIGPSTYIAQGLPWFELYDENIPTANAYSSPGILATKVKSVGALLKSPQSDSKDEQSLAPICRGCNTEMATLTLIPCCHNLCDSCGNTCHSCTICNNEISARRRFAVPVGTNEAVVQGGQEALAESHDDRITQLFTKTKSIGDSLKIWKQHFKADKNIAPGCGGCNTEMATLTLIPCRHNLCDNCANTWDSCPVCNKAIDARRRFAAPMGIDEVVNRDGQGVLAGSHDVRIQRLLLNRGTRTVTSFRSANEAVSCLTSGEGQSGWWSD